MSKKMNAIAVLGLLVTSVTATAGPAASLSADDRLQILELVSSYSWAYDGKDVDRFVGLFTEDCLWEAYAGPERKPVARAKGRDELRAVVTPRLAMLQQKGIQSRHYQTNTVLTVAPDGRVEGQTMLSVAWAVPGDKPATVMTGTYSDVFQKVDGAWKFARRSFYFDQPEMAR